MVNTLSSPTRRSKLSGLLLLLFFVAAAPGLTESALAQVDDTDEMPALLGSLGAQEFEIAEAGSPPEMQACSRP